MESELESDSESNLGSDSVLDLDLVLDLDSDFGLGFEMPVLAINTTLMYRCGGCCFPDSGFQILASSQFLLSPTQDRTL